ncbi:MAG TPA: hypothetical protein VF611_20925 [Pyrinomonadaceae bacterium]
MRRLFAVLFAVAVAAAGAAAASRQVQWQWSESPSVRIGVRDKNEDLRGYEATFVVTSARTGRRWERKIKVEGDHFGYQNFPDDFAAFDWASHAPRFNWTCTVGGKVVVRGRFMLATTSEMEEDERRAAPPRRRRPGR